MRIDDEDDRAPGAARTNGPTPLVNGMAPGVAAEDRPAPPMAPVRPLRLKVPPPIAIANRGQPDRRVSERELDLTQTLVGNARWLLVELERGRWIEPPKPEHWRTCLNTVSVLERTLGVEQGSLDLIVKTGAAAGWGVAELYYQREMVYNKSRAAILQVAHRMLRETEAYVGNPANAVTDPAEWRRQRDVLVRATGLIGRYPPRPEGGLAAINRARREGWSPKQMDTLKSRWKQAADVRVAWWRERGVIIEQPQPKRGKKAPEVEAPKKDLAEPGLDLELVLLRQSNAKKQTVVSLDRHIPDWRGFAFRAARSRARDDNELDAIAVMMSCGPRPCELRKGIQVTVVDLNKLDTLVGLAGGPGKITDEDLNDPDLRVPPQRFGDHSLRLGVLLRVEGGKFKLDPDNPRHDKGQEWRGIVVHTDRPESQHLLSTVARRGQGCVVAIGDTTAFKDRVRRLHKHALELAVADARKKLGVKITRDMATVAARLSVTPYCYRHAFSADLKVQAAVAAWEHENPGVKLTPEERHQMAERHAEMLAQSLGHVTARMPEFYGAARRGQRRPVPGPTVALTFASRSVRGVDRRLRPGPSARRGKAAAPRGGDVVGEATPRDSEVGEVFLTGANRTY